MNSIETLATFFGWCTVINLGFYLLTVGALALFRGIAQKMMMAIFKISEADVALENFKYVARYKLAIIVLCLVPYVALKMML